MKVKTEKVMQYVPTGETYDVELFEFFELNDGIKKRIAREYLEDNAEAIAFEFQESQESEIWECVRDLEKSICGARVKWHYNRWYSCDFDIEYRYDDCYSPCELDAVNDTGHCASMDICDAWNGHIRKLNAIYHELEYLGHLDNDVYPYWSRDCDVIRENVLFNSRIEELQDRYIGLWYEELEKACEDVADTIQRLLIDEWEYMNDIEYALIRLEDESEAGGEWRTCEYPYYKNGGYTGRIFYNDTRKWYTAYGELYEQANVNHECVSIVKVA